MADSTLIYYYMVFIAGGILAYAYLLYPVVAFVLERIFYTPVKKQPIIPKISIIISAHNEEDVIAEKIENLLSLDYPGDKMTIIIASDGSTDDTVKEARKFEDRGIIVHEHKVRKGKANVLNAEVPKCQTDLVVLADSRQKLAKDALRNLVENFADERIGAVSGELILEESDSPGIGKGMGFYWRYEKFIRVCESGIHSTVGATGALLAVRKSLWQGLPSNTVVDDMVLPFQVIKQGFRVVLETSAKVYDRVSESWEREFVRKVRTLGGNFQILFNMKKMGLPLFSPVSFQFFSHKVMRLLGPLALVLFFWGNYWLFRITHDNGDLHESILWGGLLAFQGILYVLSILGFCSERLDVKLPFVHVPYSFLLTQIAIVCGFLRFGSGREEAVWEKTITFEKNSLNNRLVRLFADSTIFCFGFIAAFYLRYWGDPPKHIFYLFSNLNPSFEIGDFKFAIPIIMLVPLTVFYFFRINERRAVDTTPEFFLTILYAIFSGTIVVILLIYNMRSNLTIAYEGKVFSFPTAVILISFFINCLFIFGWRIIFKIIHTHALETEGTWRDVLIVSEGRIEKTIIRGVEEGSPNPTKVSGTVGPVAHKAFVDMAREEDIGSMPSILNTDELIAAAGLLSRAQTMEVLNSAEKHGVKSAILPGELELILGVAKLRLISYIPVLPAWRDYFIEPVRFLKRVLDICWGVILLLISIPGTALYLLCNGFAFKKYLRVGRDCRMIMLRRPSAVSIGIFKRPARRFFLAISLLKGDLALVGPRAVSIRGFEGASILEKSFLSVRPGLIGPSNIKLAGKCRIRKCFIPFVFYVCSFSLGFDIYYLAQRLSSVFKNKKTGK